MFASRLSLRDTAGPVAELAAEQTANVAEIILAQPHRSVVQTTRDRHAGFNRAASSSW